MYLTEHPEIKFLGELTWDSGKHFKLPEPQINSRIFCKNGFIVE